LVVAAAERASFVQLSLIVPRKSCTQRITPTIHTPITVNGISGMHNAFTETGGNRRIQNQLITPATPIRACSELAANLVPVDRAGHVVPFFIAPHG
jgi:hypothetical protein